MGWLERMKHLMKTNIGLVNIIAAALLVELVSGVMYPKQPILTVFCSASYSEYGYKDTFFI